MLPLVQLLQGMEIHSCTFRSDPLKYPVGYTKIYNSVTTLGFGIFKQAEGGCIIVDLCLIPVNNNTCLNPLRQKKNVCLLSPDRLHATSEPIHYFKNLFTIWRFFSLEINIFGLKTFQTVHTRSKDIYGDRKAKLDCVKESNTLI